MYGFSGHSVWYRFIYLHSQPIIINCMNDSAFRFRFFFFNCFADFPNWSATNHAHTTNTSTVRKCIYRCSRFLYIVHCERFVRNGVIGTIIYFHPPMECWMQKNVNESSEKCIWIVWNMCHANIKAFGFLQFARRSRETEWVGEWARATYQSTQLRKWRKGTISGCKQFYHCCIKYGRVKWNAKNSNNLVTLLHEKCWAFCGLNVGEFSPCQQHNK